MKPGRFFANITIACLSCLLLCACDLPTQKGPQPTELIDTEFRPGHNILGILRLDHVPGSSFIRVERAYRNEETGDDFTTLIENAWVMVESDSERFPFVFVPDSSRGDVYICPDFSPVEGSRYDVTIRSPGLPDLTGTAIVPSSPEIIPASITISGQVIRFTIVTSQEIELYDVFLISSLEQRSIRLLNDSDSLQVQLDATGMHMAPDRIELYGYEANLARYLTSSITIKPQAYHEAVTTVFNGYGCFGALSKTTLTFDP